MDYIEGIEGWFGFPGIYASMVQCAPQQAHFVEIGAWKGASTAYMAVTIANSGKNIKFDCIDIWEYDPTSPEYFHNTADLYEIFLKNIEPVKEYVNPIRAKSEDCASLYENESLDFVFIDGNHEYEYVYKDIAMYLPKIKPGGFIGGDDWHYEPIKRAVGELLGEVKAVEAGWLYRKGS